MLEFELPDEQPTLFEVVGQIPEEKAVELEESVETLESLGTVESRFRGENRFIIGDPVVLPLSLDGQPIAPEIQAQLDRYEFCQVNLACSFDPAPGCRFHTARFEAALQADPASPAAIAYDLFPALVEDELKISRKLSFDPNLKFKVGILDVNVGGIPLKAEQTKEYIAYTSRIAAAGLQSSQASWSFVRTQSREIIGSYKLVALVRKPKGSQVKANLSLTASIEVVLDLGPIGPIPLSTTRRKQGSIVDEIAVPLC